MKNEQPSEQKIAQPSIIFTEYYGVVFLSIIALFILNALFILRPMIERVKQLNVETTSELRNNVTEQAYLDSLEKSIIAARTISPDVLKRVDQALPEEGDIPQLLIVLSSLAYSNNVKIGAIAFSENKSALLASGAIPVSTVDISLTIQARTYDEAKHFLKDLETSLRLIDIYSLSTVSTSDTVDFTLQMRAYSYGQSGASPAPLKK